MNYSNIGQAIREVRIQNKVRQGELAQRIGISQNSLSLIELGKSLPHQGTIQKIELFLGVKFYTIVVNAIKP